MTNDQTRMTRLQIPTACLSLCVLAPVRAESLLSFRWKSEKVLRFAWKCLTSPRGLRYHSPW